MTIDPKTTRRSMLKWGTMAGAASMFSGRLLASGGIDRAVVMILLVGGNDSNNMIVPYEDDAYSTYARARGSLALPKSSLLSVSSVRQKQSFGFHPAMAEVQGLYNSGRLAVVANQGWLKGPSPVVRRKPLPLFRGVQVPEFALHDLGQQAQFVRPGAGFAPWAVEQQRQVTDPTDDAPQAIKFGPVGALSLDRPKVDLAAWNEALVKADINTRFPDTYIGNQLLKIAKLIQISPGLGFTRPLFTAMMDGFDTHIDQMAKQVTLFSELSQGLGAFENAIAELGASFRVTTFTHTEFNRTLAPNNTGGTEHAWGGHSLIMGGSVTGGDIYGTFPSADGPENIGGTGIFLPSISGDEYMGMIGRWFGARVDIARDPGVLH